jgi:subtilisin family serine protease
MMTSKFPTELFKLTLILAFRAKQADGWFEFLRSNVHTEVDRDRKDGMKRVHVAILDSGVDATHPDIVLALETKQIAAFKGFPESLNPLQDQHGHGTHGASVLMKTAPNATLYIARIVDDKGKISEKNDYLNTVDVSLQYHNHVG